MRNFYGTFAGINIIDLLAEVLQNFIRKSGAIITDFENQLLIADFSGDRKDAEYVYAVVAVVQRIFYKRLKCQFRNFNMFQSVWHINLI